VQSRQYFPRAGVRFGQHPAPDQLGLPFIFLGCTIYLRIAPYIRVTAGLGSLGAGG
jgi:hypothetical protein